MGDIGAISGAVASVSSLIEGILDRADRDGPDKELNENITNIQNGFLSVDPELTELGILVQLLLAKAGNPATPSRDPGIYKREIMHALLISLAQLIYERRLAARAIAKLTAK